MLLYQVLADVECCEARSGQGRAAREKEGGGRVTGDGLAWPVQSLSAVSLGHSLPRMSSHVNKLETLFLLKVSVKIFLQPAVCIICVTSERRGEERRGEVLTDQSRADNDDGCHPAPGTSSFQ